MQNLEMNKWKDEVAKLEEELEMIRSEGEEEVSASDSCSEELRMGDWDSIIGRHGTFIRGVPIPTQKSVSNAITSPLMRLTMLVTDTEEDGESGGLDEAPRRRVK